MQAGVAAEGDQLDLERADLFRATEELDYTARVVDGTLRLYPAGIWQLCESVFGMWRTGVGRGERVGFTVAR